MAESYSVEAVLSARDAGFTSSMRNAGKEVGALGKLTSGIKFGAMMAAGGKAFSVITSGAKGLVSELNASQATWKTFESNMKNFGKSSQTIKKVKGDLQDFATKSIYSASDMASTYSQLSAVGTKNTTDLVKAFGGLAAAAENPQQAMKTLSQQATQMAAKPKVQWMDFKLMMEQTPAGIAQVAKAMGISTQQLVKDVQDGKVKTEDFFNAMRKAGGEGTALNKMATQYKTMGQAIDGVKESLTTKLQPAFDVVSNYGIKAINKLEGVLSKVNGDKIAKALSKGLSVASSVASKVFAKIAPVAASAGKTLYNFGKAVFDVGRSIASNKSFVDSLKQGFTRLSTGVGKASSFLSKHSSTIGKLAPVFLRIAAVLLAAKTATSIFGKTTLSTSRKSSAAAKTIKAVFDGLGTVLKNFGALAKGVGQGLGAAFKGMGPMFQGLGKGISTVIQGIAKAFNTLKPQGLLMFAGSVAVVVAALGALGALRGVILPFLNGVVGVFGNLINVLRSGTDVILTLVNGAMTGLANALVIVAPAINPISQAFRVLGTVITSLISVLPPLVTALGTAISTVVTAVGKAVSGIAKAITPIVEIVSKAIVQIVQALAPYIPEITKMVQATSTAVQAVAGAFKTLFGNLSGIFNSIAGVIRTFAGGAVAVINAFSTGACAVLTTFGNTVNTILTSAGNFFTTFANAVSTVLSSFSTTVTTVLTSVGTLFTTFGTTVQTIMNSISTVVTSVGTAISGVLNSIAGIFDSMGGAALNAGKGVKLLASGIKTLVGLSLADLAGTLTAVAVGLGKMASSGSGLAKAGTSIAKIGKSCKTAATGLNVVNAASAKTMASLNKLATIATTTGTRLGTAGKKGGTTFATGLNTGITKAVTKTNSNLNKIKRYMSTAATKARSQGQKMGQNFANAFKTAGSKAVNHASTIINNVASRISSGVGKMHSVGRQLGNGVAQGLRAALPAVRSAANAIVEQANRASQAKAKIGSPSRLMAKEVGRPLATGIAKGMKQETGFVVKTAQSIVKQLVTAAKKTEGKYSSTWENVQKSATNGINANQTAILKASKTHVKTVVDKYYNLAGIQSEMDKNTAKIAKNKKRINAYTSANDKISSRLERVTAKLNKRLKKATTKHEKKVIKNQIASAKAQAKKQTKANKKAIKSLKKSNTKLSEANKKKNTELKKNTKLSNALITKLYAEYEKRIKDGTTKATSAINAQVNAITSKYQSLYDTIANQRSTFYGNLSDYGSLYEADQYGYIAFKNWNKSIKEMTTLQANLKKLQKIGVSQGFLSEITSMNTAEALTYTNALLKKGTTFIKEQSNGYEKMMATAKKISTNVYKPYVDAIDKAYNNDLVKSLSSLTAKLKKIGESAASALNSGIKKALAKATPIKKTTKKTTKKTKKQYVNMGMSTSVGFGKGVDAKYRVIDMAMKKTASKSTKTTKKKLKIHSPSKVFAQIGQMTGVGFAQGMESVGHKIQTATSNMVHIPSASTPSYAGLSDNYTYGSGYYEVTVVSEIDGKEFARATVDPMSEELNRKNRNNNRNRGQR